MELYDIHSKWLKQEVESTSVAFEFIFNKSLAFGEILETGKEQIQCLIFTFSFKMYN